LKGIGGKQMKLPAYFIEKIRQAFGEKGEKWLENLPQIYTKSIKKWSLTNCSLAGDLSHNLIVFAMSPEYGSVALKIGVPHDDLFTEMRALVLYEGRNICRCYDVDKELGAILIERISPGVNLKSEKNHSTRIKIASEVIANLAIPVEEDHNLPSYAYWLNKAFSRAREENKVSQKMLSLIDMAERMYCEIEASDRPKILLHGDLHHFNILLDQNGDWKAIDPKGVIGQACMDCARFMENQLDMVPYEEQEKYLDEMITVFSTTFKEPKQMIATCLFIDYVLSTCWTFEDGTLDQTEQIEAIDRFKYVTRYLKEDELEEIERKQNHRRGDD
jgi:streptomycin 6-kinase